MLTGAGVRWLLLLALASAGHAQSVCPPIGARGELGTVTAGRRLMLDLATPSQCSGLVAGWRYCAHEQSFSSTVQSMSAIFAIFQPSSPGSLIYTAINASLTTIRLNESDFEGRRFVCKDVRLAEKDFFTFPQNAVVGVCSSVGSAGLALTSIPPGSQQTFLDVRRVEDQIYDICSAAEVAGSDISIVRVNRVAVDLHVEALMISPINPTQCLAGSKSAATSQSSARGVFLDVRNPAPCFGTLVAWNYCFYPASLRARGTLSVMVGVWQFDKELGRYVVLESSLDVLSEDILQQQNFNQLPHFLCGTKTVTSGVEIPQGGVVAVVANSSGSGLTRLPVLGMAFGDNDYLLNLETSTNESLRMHVSAVIQGVAPSSTAVVGVASGIGVGVAAGVGLVVGILVVLVAAVISVLLCLFWRSRRNQTRSSTLKTYAEEPVFSGSYAKGALNDSVAPNPHDNPPNKAASKAAPPPRPALPTRLMKPKRPPPRPVHKTFSVPIRTDSGNAPPTSSSLKASTLSRSPEYAELSKIYPDGKEDTRYAMLLQTNLERDVYSNLTHYMMPATDRNSLYNQLKNMKTRSIKPEHVSETGRLGSGQFGCVMKGEWLDGTKKVPVALKTLNKGTSPENMVKFLQEAAITAQFKHPNVINLYGVVAAEKEPVLVVELADGGDLKQHLEGLRKSVTDASMLELSQLLLRFSQQIAFGMQYLSRKGFIHRDLAARNILVFGTKICKIADFGMSRDLPVDGIYVSSGGVIPLKWTALEAIHYKEFSTASDVWSYGCVLYEIWSLGHKPFEFEELGQKVVRMLRSGIRLPPPPGCSRAIYSIMIRSWHHEPDERPSFRQIVVDLVDSRGEKNTLFIPEEDLDSHPDAGRLGAELEAGADMYTDLQDTYR